MADVIASDAGLKFGEARQNFRNRRLHQSRLPKSGSGDASKTDMTRRGVDRFGVAGGGSISATVVRRAEVGTTL